MTTILIVAGRAMGAFNSTSGQIGLPPKPALRAPVAAPLKNLYQRAMFRNSGYCRKISPLCGPLRSVTTRT